MDTWQKQIWFYWFHEVGIVSLIQSCLENSIYPLRARKWALILNGVRMINELVCPQLKLIIYGLNTGKDFDVLLIGKKRYCTTYLEALGGITLDLHRLNFSRRYNTADVTIGSRRSRNLEISIEKRMNLARRSFNDFCMNFKWLLKRNPSKEAMTILIPMWMIARLSKIHNVISTSRGPESWN